MAVCFSRGLYAKGTKGTALDTCNFFKKGPMWKVSTSNTWLTSIFPNSDSVISWGPLYATHLSSRAPCCCTWLKENNSLIISSRGTPCGNPSLALLCQGSCEVWCTVNNAAVEPKIGIKSFVTWFFFFLNTCQKLKWNLAIFIKNTAYMFRIFIQALLLFD